MTAEQALLQVIAELQLRINAMQQRMAALAEENRALKEDAKGGEP